MSLVIANIPAMFPSYKLGSKSKTFSLLVLPYEAYQPYCIHKFCKEQGEDPPQILLQIKAFSPKSTNSKKKKACAGHRVSLSALQGFLMLRADAWSLQLLMEATGSSLYLCSPRMGSVPPRAPVGFCRTGREKSSPWDAQNYLHLQSRLSLKEMSDTHCQAQELAFVSENSNIYDDLLFLSPRMIMINIPRAGNIYLDHPYTL